MRLGFVVVVLAGCVSSSSTVCGDRICPEGTACAELVGVGGDPHRCVDRDAIGACAGIAVLDSCSYPDVAMGACYATTDGEVCLEAGCGNGLVDKTEVCDDGNADFGDGCSQACRSDETCGNGVVDPTKFDANQSLVPNERCDDGNTLGHDECDVCQPESPTWTSIAQDLPPARQYVPIAFDPVRRRFVMFGGEHHSGINAFVSPLVAFGDTWEGDGTSWVQLHPTVSPTIRFGSGLAYDAAIARTVLFGGNDGQVRNDTWEWDGTRWTPVSPATSPPPRFHMGFAYDSKRKVVVMFGGADENGAETADTWEWNGTTWRQVATATTPPPHASPSMAFDPVRGVVVMAGLDDLSNLDTWEYDGTNWTKKAATTPMISATGMIAYDSVGHRMIAMAGPIGATTTHGWDGSVWSDLTAVQGGDVRYPTLVSDPIAGRVLSFGGRKQACGGPNCAYASTNETWSWDGATWTAKPLTIPDPRAGSAAVFDSRHNSIVLVGGSDGLTAPFRDTWQLDGLAWTKTTDQPWLEGRQWPAAAYDSTRDEIVVFGGYDGFTDHNDTWVRANGAWTEKTSTMTPPEREAHVMAYDLDHRSVILFGGNSFGFIEGDTWAWDGAAWLEQSPAHAPAARQDASLAWDPVRHRLVLFGGFDGSKNFGDTWTWDGTDWTEHTSALGPPPRKSAGFAWDAARQALVLVGGINIGGDLADSWEWNGTTWTPLVAANAPVARDQAVVVQAPGGAGVVMIGGKETNVSNQALGDQWRLRWDGEQTYEQCTTTADIDGDSLKGCEDPDCWATCTPLCPPGTTCDPSAPRCGDHICDSVVENCRICPGDCTCTAACGDTFCDAPETQATCPGDCTP